MPNKAQLKAALEQADAILALEGMVKPAGFEVLQQAVINGELTFDQAVAQVVAEAKALAAATPAAKGPAH
jgi:hypothetical protein